MQACSENERKFVWFWVTGDGDATAAARAAGYVDNDTGAIRVTAHRLIHRDRVIEAIEEVGRKAFRGLLVPALRATRDLIDKPDHPDHLKAVNATLSRLGLVERSGVDVNVSGEVTVNHTDASLNDLRILKAMGAAREKLLEAFGHSGLPRLEKMLEEADRRAGPLPKLIEGEAVRDGG